MMLRFWSQNRVPMSSEQHLSRQYLNLNKNQDRLARIDHHPHPPHRKADRPRAALSGLRHGHDTLRLRLVIARYHAGCSDDATARCAAMQSKVLQHGHVLLEERRFETRLGAPQSSRLPITHQLEVHSTGGGAKLQPFSHCTAATWLRFDFAK